MGLKSGVTVIAAMAVILWYIPSYSISYMRSWIGHMFFWTDIVAHVSLSE